MIPLLIKKERLCLKSRRKVGAPGHTVSHHRVDDREHFAHAGGDGDLFSLTRGNESLMKSANNGVGTNSRQRRHVKHGANIVTASLNVALATIFAAIPIEGCDTDQRGDLPAVQMAEF